MRPWREAASAWRFAFSVAAESGAQADCEGFETSTISSSSSADPAVLPAALDEGAAALACSLLKGSDGWVSSSCSATRGFVEAVGCFVGVSAEKSGWRCGESAEELTARCISDKGAGSKAC